MERCILSLAVRVGMELGVAGVRNIILCATGVQIQDEVAVALADTMSRYHISRNQRRIGHFLAQVTHESGVFQFTEEVGGGELYEGRGDLGNIFPGDGPRYRGRGLIQLTGRWNYEAYSRATRIDYVRHPELLRDYPAAADVAGWYWKVNGLNELADRDDLRNITYRINGGYNGYADRKHWLGRYRRCLETYAYTIPR